jgi:preprotein translocase subunit SecD
MTLSRDPRVVIYVLAVAAALVLIAPLPTEHGLDSRLKYGLDLEGGSWLQLQLQGAIVQLDCDAKRILEEQFRQAGNVKEIERRGDSFVITLDGKVPKTMAESLGYPGAKAVERANQTKVTIVASPEYIIQNYLRKALEADVVMVGTEPVRYEIRSKVTRDSLNAVLAPVNGTVVPGEEGFIEGVTPETVDETKKILDQKLNRLGLKDIKVRVVGNQFILIDMAGMNVSSAQNVVGKPGKFEIRIQTEVNESMHVLYGDAVVAVDIPRADQGGMWGVPFTLSEDGAEILRKAAIDSGATRNPQAHEISMHLDKDVVFSAPLAPDLAASMEKAPIRNLVAEVGAGDEGSRKAKELSIHLKEGALPVNVEIIGSGQVAPALGSKFKTQMTIAGIIALAAVAFLVYRRYRKKRIVAPMVATSFGEVIMMLGIWAAAGWQLDLASLAGIITVIGTGVDHLIIITDELLRGETEKGEEEKPSSKNTKKKAVEEKVPEGKLSLPGGKVYLTRLSRAFAIILGAALTTIAGMFPLVWMGFGALKGFALIIIIGVLIGVGIARPAYGRIIGYILAEERGAA